MNDESIMPFGIHKDKKLKDVPDEYLLWLYGEIDPNRHPELAAYLKDNIDAIKSNLKSTKK